MYAMAGAVVRHVVLRAWPDASPHLALAAAGGVTAALTARWLYRIRHKPDAYWQLLPAHWEVAFQLLQTVFDRFLADVASGPSQYPTVTNLYLLSIVHSDNLALESTRRAHLIPPSLAIPTTPEHALELHLFTRFAFCSYGFYLAAMFHSKEPPAPLEDLLVRKTGIAPEDLLYFNHSVAAALQPSIRRHAVGPDSDDGGLPRYLIALHRPSKSIVLGIRGSVALSDWAIDLICENVPFLTGFAHSGILWAAKQLLIDATPHLHRAMARYPECDRLVITGHSLGGGIATLLSMLLLSDLESLPLRLTEAQRARLLCVAVAPPPVVGPPHAVATMCGRVNLDSHIFTIVNRFDVVPRLSYRSVTRLSRQLDVVDSLPLSLSERFEIMRTGDASKLRSVLTPAALAALSFAPTYGPEDEAHQEVSTPGKIFFKDEHDGWRLQPAAAFRHIVLSSAMVTDHFPDNYVTMFESKITAASTSTESSAAGEAKAGEADKLKHN